MHRIRELRSLSEDHHHGLVLARKARKTSVEGLACEKIWVEVVEKFKTELEPHFCIEEEFIAIPLADVGETGLVERFQEEHQALRECIAQTTGEFKEKLAQFGELLESHIRFEERQFFEVVQERFDKHSLSALEEACQRRRRGSSA